MNPSTVGRGLTFNPTLLRVGSLALIFLLLIIIRIPALSGPINLSQDATEYIDIARNVAQGEGLTLKIRSYFFADGYTLPYPAASLRSPMFPFLMGQALALLGTSRVFQWFNFCLFLINMTLLGFILRRVLPFWILAYALLLVGMSEPMFLTSIFPWAEQTAFLWLLLSLLLASTELQRRWGAAGAFLQGIAAALAALSRPEYILVGPLFLIWLAMERERRVQGICAFLLGFLGPLGWVSATNFHQYGRLFLPGDYLFMSRQYSTYFSWNNSGAESAGRFIAANWPWIIWRILRNVVNYTAKLIGWKDLFALSAFLPLILRDALWHTSDWRKLHLVVVPAAYFIVYCMIWAGIDRERYLLAITSFLLPLCLLEGDRWRKMARLPWIRLACTGIIFANLPLLLGYTISSDLKMLQRHRSAERFYAKDNPAWSNPDLPLLVKWIRENVGSTETICLENPFLVNFETGRMTLLLPERARADRFAAFLSYYKVRYWVTNNLFTKYPNERLIELRNAVREAGGKEVARCGSYEVWRLP